jgi:hypothetical protein
VEKVEGRCEKARSFVVLERNPEDAVPLKSCTIVGEYSRSWRPPLLFEGHKAHAAAIPRQRAQHGKALALAERVVEAPVSHVYGVQSP